MLGLGLKDLGCSESREDGPRWGRGMRLFGFGLKV